MHFISSNDLITQLQWRYATKSFDSSKKIPEDQWKALCQSLIFSPSSYGLQPWKFLIVQNQELRKKLRAHSWNQAQVEEACHYVVLCYLKDIDEAHVEKFIRRMCEVRGISEDSILTYKNLVVGNVTKGNQVKDKNAWAARQCYIALGFLMQSAALMGIDTCPMEGIDPEKYDEILDLKNSP
ncbi:MAG: NAD(P)H-dependent oxidoreductase, partial [Deltaproteobacteria bacterium]|nr:NAD(P)H-dependent oxidoreductase [Deltaproteobacteria bacterium]